jgi:hypothetical protein
LEKLLGKERLVKDRKERKSVSENLERTLVKRIDERN